MSLNFWADDALGYPNGIATKNRDKSLSAVHNLSIMVQKLTEHHLSIKPTFFIHPKPPNTILRAEHCNSSQIN